MQRIFSKTNIYKCKNGNHTSTKRDRKTQHLKTPILPEISESESQDFKKHQVHWENKISQAVLRHRRFEVNVVIRRYLRELYLIICFSSEHQLFFLITGVRRNYSKNTQKMNKIKDSKKYEIEWSIHSIKIKNR